jgi:Flp pilus assembly protein protease CpaA
MDGFTFSTVDIPVAALLLVALFTDISRQRVPNRLTLGGIAIGLAWSAMSGDLSTLFFSIKGVLAAFCVMFPGWLLGGAIRAGDAKLLMAVGAFYGPTFAFCAGVLLYMLALPFGIAVLVYKRKISGFWSRTVTAINRGSGESSSLTVVPFVPVVVTSVVLVRTTEVFSW